MLKRYNTRLLSGLLYSTRRLIGSYSIRKAVKFVIFLYALAVLSVYEMFFSDSYLFVSSYGELLRKAAYRLERDIPRVKHVNCNIFMDARQPWNERLDNLSSMKSTQEEMYDGTCSFRRRETWNVPTSLLEQSFPIAYTIMIYTDFDRFTHLLRAIYRDNNVYCVHVDQSSDNDFKIKVETFVQCFGNVFLPPDQVDVNWGFYSVLEAELVCFKALWASKTKWLALINLTGQEFPLKTNLELVHILKLMNGQNDAWIDPCTYEGPGDYKSSQCTIITDEGFRDRWRKIESAPFRITPYKGQVHVVLFRAAVDFILHSYVSRIFLTWVNRTYIPDELYFTSLNSNTHIGYPGGNTDPLQTRQSIARFKLWWNRHEKVSNTCDVYVRDICQLSPKELVLLTSSPQLFANKFKNDFKPLGYDCLEEWLFQKVVTELRLNKIQLNLTFYSELFNTWKNQ